MPEAMIGQTCVYYHGGNKDATPAAAIVIAIDQNNPDGPIELSLVPRYGGVGQTIKQNVRHVDDPFYKARPEMAVEYGAWDTCEGAHAFTQEQREKRRRLARKAERDKDDGQRKREEAREQDELEASVLAHHRAGKTSDIIRRAMQNRLTITEIRAILAKNGKSENIANTDRKTEAVTG